MANHDYVIDNGSGSTVRADINSALQAIVTTNSSSTEPSATFDKMLWHDTTENALKQRNSSAFTGVRLFSPIVKNGLLDVNNLDIIKFSPTATAVNQLTVANATTGNTPTISATGTDSNVNLALTPKGNASVFVPAGTTTNPSISISTDSNTGLYFPSADTIGFVEGGTGYLMGYRSLPNAGTKTTSYTLQLSDRGKLITVNTGGSITIPDTGGSIGFAIGDVVYIYNGTSSAITITRGSGLTLYQSGVNSNVSSISVASRAIAVIQYVATSTAVFSVQIVSLQLGEGTVLIPVGTTAQRPASPVQGEMRYNSSIGAPEFYNSTSAEWQFPAQMASVGSGTSTQRAIFGYGLTSGSVSMTNLVSNAGVVATDVTGVGTARYGLAAAGYGGDKAIFGYGYTPGLVSMTNLVSNAGVVAGDVTGVGTARYGLAAAGYGGDKAIFGYGLTGSYVSMTNLVSNAGVVAGDVTGVGTARYELAAAGYGGDKAIFGYGRDDSSYFSMTNLVSNAGVVAANVTGVGTARSYLAAAGYGGDKAIFGYGRTPSVVSMTNLVSNAGVVANDTAGVGTARYGLAAAGYGGDKAIFGYGLTGSAVSMTNLVSNAGIVANDTTGVGTARYGLAAAGYST